MYLSTPLGKVIALDPVSGAQKLGARCRREARPSLRRLGESWRVVLARFARETGRHLHAPHFLRRRRRALGRARRGTGEYCLEFGKGGIVDLVPLLRNKQSYGDEYEQTSPPAIIGDLIVVGSAIADNNSNVGATGEVRGIRCAHRRAALDLESRAAGPGRSCLQDLERLGRASHRRRQYLVDHRGRSRSAISCSCRPPVPRSTTTASRGSATTATRTLSSPARIDRKDRLAFPDRASRPLGLRQCGAAGAGHAAGRQGRRVAGNEDGAVVRARSRDRRTAVSGEEIAVPKSDIPGEDHLARRSRSRRSGTEFGR